MSAQRSPLARAGLVALGLLLIVVGGGWISAMRFAGGWSGWSLGLVLWTVIGAGLLFVAAALALARSVADRVPRALVVALFGALAVAIGVSAGIYEISAAPSARETTVAPDTAKPVIGKAVTFGRQPVAGRRFVVRFDVMRSTGGPMLGGTMVCNPTVRGKLIPHTEDFISGNAWLFVSIPMSAKGKLLSVKLTIRANGWTTGRVASFRIT